MLQVPSRKTEYPINRDGKRYPYVVTSPVVLSVIGSRAISNFTKGESVNS